MVMTSCKEEMVPTSVSMSADQLEITGKTASSVRKDTAAIVFMRDTVADEKADSFMLRTTLTLLLDSVFPTDKMDGSVALTLTTQDGAEQTTLHPVDSVLADSLIQFLQKKPGESIDIVFEGLVERSQLMKMAAGVKAVMDGFSFIYADPKANYLLNEYRKGLDALNDLAREAKQTSARDPFSSIFYVMAVAQVVDQIEKKIDRKLVAMKDKMSPTQLDRYNAYHSEWLVWNNQQKQQKKRR